MATTTERASTSAAAREQHRPDRPALLEPDDLAGQHQLGAEPRDLGERALGEVGAAQALGEAEVVLDRRALAGLSARGLALDDDRAEPLGSGVHPGREPGRAAADDADVVERLLGLDVRGRGRRRPRASVGDRSGSRSGTSTSGRSVARATGQLEQPPALLVALDVVPAVGDVVAGEERLQLVGAVRPAVADHLDVVGDLRVAASPVAEQVVDHREQPVLGRVPRLEQVVVEADVVDRGDRDVGVGVRREQQALGLRRDVAATRPAARSRSSPASAGRSTISATGSVRSASADSSSSAWARRRRRQHPVRPSRTGA